MSDKISSVHLNRVANTGPLTSLLTANVIRDEYLMISKDLANTFMILASGEKLLVSMAARYASVDECTCASIIHRVPAAGV